jgi:hypothetical protein
VIVSSSFYFGSKKPEPKPKQNNSPKLKKLAAAVNYFLNGQYSKILDAEEEEAEFESIDEILEKK